MEIVLLPGEGCQLSCTIGNLHLVPTLNAHETHLVLAKVTLGKADLPRHVKEASSDQLIAELQTDLGDSITSYLTVRVAYKHSGFPDLINPVIDTEGLSSHSTQLQTDATAVIKRHNSQSAWSPRTSQMMVDPLGTNPLVRLIERHFSPVRARETIKRLADDRMPIPMAKRFNLLGSSEETVKPPNTVIAASIESAVGDWPDPPTPSIPDFSVSALSEPFAPFPQAYLPFENSVEEVDPARKIWLEMRRNSGYGRHRRPRTSVSANHFYSFEDDSPSRNSSGDNSAATISAGFGSKKKGEEIEQFRNNYIGMALRNKRSIGADTLDSLAVNEVERKGRGGGLGTIGIGLGQQWPPWWKSWLS